MSKTKAKSIYGHEIVKLIKETAQIIKNSKEKTTKIISLTIYLKKEDAQKKKLVSLYYFSIVEKQSNFSLVIRDVTI